MSELTPAPPAPLVAYGLLYRYASPLFLSLSKERQMSLCTQAGMGEVELAEIEAYMSWEVSPAQSDPPYFPAVEHSRIQHLLAFEYLDQSDQEQRATCEAAGIHPDVHKGLSEFVLWTRENAQPLHIFTKRPPKRFLEMDSANV